jgi:hypothetical protein
LIALKGLTLTLTLEKKHLYDSQHTILQSLIILLHLSQIVKVFGIVASADNFHEQHLVVNGCSDVLGEVFGKEVKLLEIIILRPYVRMKNSASSHVLPVFSFQGGWATRAVGHWHKRFTPWCRSRNRVHCSHQAQILGILHMRTHAAHTCLLAWLFKCGHFFECATRTAE